MNCRKCCTIFFRCLLLPFKLVLFFFFWLLLNILPCLKYLPCELCLRMGFGSSEQRIHPMLGHSHPGYNFGCGALCSICSQMTAFACGAPLMEGDTCVEFDLYDLRNNEVFELQVNLSSSEEETASPTDENAEPENTDGNYQAPSPEHTIPSPVKSTSSSVQAEVLKPPTTELKLARNDSEQTSDGTGLKSVRIFCFGSATAPGFMLQSGNFINMASKYSRIADFGWVYIEEAHPSDGWWTLSDNVSIKTHVALEDRIAAAKIFHDSLSRMEFIDLDLNLSTALQKIGFYVDDMEDTAASLFGAYPYRCVAIKNDHVVAVSGLGHLGFDLSPIETFLHNEFGRLKNRISRSESDGIVPFALEIR